MLCELERFVSPGWLHNGGLLILCNTLYLFKLWSCSFGTKAMPELRGPALLGTVTTLTSLGFLMIGYDNGLLGGLGMVGFRWF